MQVYTVYSLYHFTKLNWSHIQPRATNTVQTQRTTSLCAASYVGC